MIWFIALFESELANIVEFAAIVVRSM